MQRNATRRQRCTVRKTGAAAQPNGECSLIFRPPQLARAASLVACMRWSRLESDSAQLESSPLPYLASSPKMPACSGYLTRYIAKSILQAGKFGLQRRRSLDTLLQAGEIGLQRKGPSVAFNQADLNKKSYPSRVRSSERIP